MNNFSTSDFYLAAFLKAKGEKLIGAEKDPNSPNRLIFIFETNNTKKLSEEFLFEKALINPKKMREAEKDLRQLIHMKLKED